MTGAADSFDCLVAHLRSGSPEDLTEVDSHIMPDGHGLADRLQFLQHPMYRKGTGPGLNRLAEESIEDLADTYGFDYEPPPSDIELELNDIAAYEWPSGVLVTVGLLAEADPANDTAVLTDSYNWTMDGSYGAWTDRVYADLVLSGLRPPTSDELDLYLQVLNRKAEDLTEQQKRTTGHLLRLAAIDQIAEIGGPSHWALRQINQQRTATASPTN